jgi:GH15 family glucan-1,4-alpha-glucosidase
VWLAIPTHGLGLGSFKISIRLKRTSSRFRNSGLSAGAKFHRDQARLLFQRVLGYANHFGLYAEQTGPQGEALGNFPQAFTHLALISAAFNLDRVCPFVRRR